MGLLKSNIQDFLDTIGYELGYDWENLPSDVREVNMLMREFKKNDNRR